MTKGMSISVSVIIFTILAETVTFYALSFDVIIVIILGLNAMLGIAVFFDARKNFVNPAIIWAVISLFTSGLGLVVYLVARCFPKQVCDAYDGDIESSSYCSVGMRKTQK